MKKFKKLIPALAMLLVSATAMSSATFAWFSMNREVQTANMQVKAVADQGILINEVATATDENWDNAATTNQTAGINLRATSTANTGTWYVAHSVKSDNSASATAGQVSENLTSEGYKTLGTAPYATSTQTVEAAAGTNAKQEITYVDSDGTAGYANGEGYYVRYTYYIKSSGAAIETSLDANKQSFNIKEVSVTGNASGTEGPAAIDKSLRVAVVVNNKAYIYAPVSGATATYYVNASSTATTVLTGSQATSIGTIPATTSDGTPVYVYLYFEGEDTGVKTSNVTGDLSNLTVSVNFELKDNATAATDNGVAVSAAP